MSWSVLGQDRLPSSVVGTSHCGVSGGMTHLWNGTSSAGDRLLSSVEGESVPTRHSTVNPGSLLKKPPARLEKNYSPGMKSSA